MSARHADRERQGRSSVERAVVAASVLVIALIVALLVWAEVTGPDGPPQMQTEIGVVREVDGRHVVPVTVTNVGGRTASDVVVYAEVGSGPTSTRVEQTVDHVFVDDEEQVTFVFSEDPASEGLDVGVQAYFEP